MVLVYICLFFLLQEEDEEDDGDLSKYNLDSDEDALSQPALISSKPDETGKERESSRSRSRSSRSSKSRSSSYSSSSSSSSQSSSQSGSSPPGNKDDLKSRSR